MLWGSLRGVGSVSTRPGGAIWRPQTSHGWSCRVEARCVARHALARGNGRMGHSTPHSAALAERKTLLEDI